MKKREVKEGLGLLLLSGFFINESRKLHRGGDWTLSPALFPLIITVAAFLLSLILIYRGLKKVKEEKIEETPNDNIKGVVFIVLISFFYLFILDIVGFLPSSILYLILFMLVLEEKRWLMFGTISILTPLLIQYIFSNLLDVFLP